VQQNGAVAVCSMFAQTSFCLFACLLSTSTSRPIEALDKPDGVLIEKTSAFELNWKDGAQHHAKSMPRQYIFNQ